MRARDDPLLRLVESFFRDHLQRMCGVSPHTVRSYRDTRSEERRVGKECRL